MGRRRKCRRVQQLPTACFYKPQGVPLGRLQGVTLTVDAMEAFRLVDAEGLSQEEAAERMDVSRPTLCRMLADARRVAATALSSGMAIRIEGGDYVLHDEENQTVGTAPTPDAAGGGRGRGCRKRRGRCAGSDTTDS